MAAREDLDKLAQISNQFRTCFVMVLTTPSQTIPPNGGIEIKNFLEDQRQARMDNCTLDEAIAWIDACQAQVAAYSMLARKLSKSKIELDIENEVASATVETQNYRAKKVAKSNGKIHVDKDGDEIKNPVTAGIDPIDKVMFKGIKKIQAALKCDFATARDMVMGLKK